VDFSIESYLYRMQHPFPASYSTLCPTALSALIAQKYKTGDTSCRLLVRGVGDTYLVESPENRYILRVYRSTHRSLPQIQEETDLLTVLRLAEVPVSYPVADLTGAMVQTIEAIEGVRYAVLFTYAPGQSERRLHENQLRSLGHQMARFHTISSTIREGGSRWRFDVDTTLFTPLQMAQPFFASDPEGYAWLQQAAKQAAEKLTQLSATGFSMGYCHYDFLPKNFHFEGDSVTFFDFDFMGYGWLVNDIMTFWQHLALDVYTSRMTKQEADEAYAIFLAAYRAIRPLSEQELEAVPYLSLGFWLFYMGFHTTHDQFYAFTQSTHLKAVTKLLQHMTATYWHQEPA